MNTKNIVSKAVQVSAFIMLALVFSLMWRTSLQKLFLVPFEIGQEWSKLCLPKDGCVGYWGTSYRYDPAIKAWIPVIELATTKTGKANTKLIQEKFKSAMNTHAESGLFIFKEARLRTEVTFKMSKSN